MKENYKELYILNIEKSKTQIEGEMHAIIRANFELEADIRRGEDAKRNLTKNRARMMELIKTYSRMEEK